MVRSTVTVTVVLSLAPSVAMTVIVFSPSASVLLAGSPSTVTDAMPDASEAVPAIVGGWCRWLGLYGPERSISEPFKSLYCSHLFSVTSKVPGFNPVLAIIPQLPVMIKIL